MQNLSLASNDDTEQEGDQTPQKKRTGDKRGSGTQRKLFDSPEPAVVESAVAKDGEWLENHPWDKKEPDCQTQTMADTLKMSAVYTVSSKWTTGPKNKKLGLKKIMSQLPEFINEMRGKTCRQELEDVVQIDRSSANASSTNTLKLKPIHSENISPHVKEIVDKQKGVLPNDKPSLPDGNRTMFKAYSLPRQEDQQPPENIWFLNCEYVFKIHLPGNTSQWFEFTDQTGKLIRATNPVKNNERWIFIPSFRRAKIALLDWPEDDILTSENTIRILVVRPTEFDEYVKYCGHKFPIICLPDDKIGAGYPRLWIQKIALRLKLDFIWMIDDSVECFYEYHPQDGRKEKEEGTRYVQHRERKFGLVFQRIERLVKDAKDINHPIAAMSPKRFMGGSKISDPFVCNPPRIAVFLNLKALKSKDIYYRPELQALEDMIFGYECEKNDLKVFIDNRIHLQDHKWKDTGARSSSVQQKMNEPVDSEVKSTATTS